MGLADNLARKAGEKVVVPPKPTVTAAKPAPAATPKPTATTTAKPATVQAAMAADKKAASTPAPKPTNVSAAVAADKSKTAAVVASKEAGKAAAASVSGNMAKVTVPTPAPAPSPTSGASRAQVVAGEKAAGNTTAGGQRSSATTQNWLEKQGDRLLGNADWAAEGKAMGLTDAQMDAARKTVSQPDSVKGKSTTNLQLDVLGKDNSGLMTVGRTAAYLTPVVGAGMAVAGIEQGARTGNVAQVAVNAASLALPGLVGGLSKVAKAEPVPAVVKSAEKIVKAESKVVKAEGKAAAAAANAVPKPKDVVSAAEDILKFKGITDGFKGPSGGTGSFRPTIKPGPTGGVASVKAKGVQRVDYIGAGRTQGSTQILEGGRSLSGAQGAPRAQAGVMGSVTRVEGGSTRVTQGTTTLTRDPAIVSNFGTRTITQTPDVIKAPTRTTARPGTTRPVAPTAPSITPKPAPKPAPSTPGTVPAGTPKTKPAPTTPVIPGRPAVPAPGTPGTKPGPGVAPRPDIDTVPGPKRDPNSAPGPGPKNPDPTAPQGPKVDAPTKTGKDVALKPRPDDGLSPRPDDGLSPQPKGDPSPTPRFGEPIPPRVKIDGPVKNPPPGRTRLRLPRLPDIEGNPVQQGPVQSDWQDFRGSTTSVIQKPTTQGAASVATFGVKADNKSPESTVPSTDSVDTKGRGRTGGRSGGWMYKNPTD